MTGQTAPNGGSEAAAEAKAVPTRAKEVAAAVQAAPDERKREVAAAAVQAAPTKAKKVAAAAVQAAPDKLKEEVAAAAVQAAPDKLKTAVAAAAVQAAPDKLKTAVAAAAVQAAPDKMKGVVAAAAVQATPDELEGEVAAAMVQSVVDSKESAKESERDDIRRAVSESTENTRADAERFGAAWWQQRQQSISEASSPDLRAAEWVRVFAEALLEEHFDVCARLASPEYPALPDQELLVRFARIGAQALREGRWEAAAPLLRLLVDGAWGKALPPASRASIELLLTRILVPIAAERAAVRRRLENALAHSDRDDERALLAVALGECALAGGDLAEATTSFEQAAVLNPADPAPYVGLGLIEERRGEWFTAQQQYDQAARVSDLQALARLHAPVPGNLYWRLAIKLAGTKESLEEPDPHAPVEDVEKALDAIDTALRRRITGRAEYPERRALIYRARLLERLGRRDEAANAYYEAVQRLEPLIDDAMARDYLEEACRLGPAMPVLHWTLAETLRRLAHREDGGVARELLDESVRRWQSGADIRPPGRDDAWAFATLALTKVALAKVEREVPAPKSAWWQAALLAERAVLLDGTYALGWALVAQAHNCVGNPRTALAAANRALKEDRSEPMALEQRATALISIEMIDEARQAAGLLAEDSPGGFWPRLYVLLVAREAEQALGLLSTLPIRDEPTRRYYRAICNYFLDRQTDLVQDLRWIWEHCKEAGVVVPPTGLAWAAYRIGMYDAAEKRYREILAGSNQHGLDPYAACDLGQLLLERGDHARDDFADGEALLESGVRAHDAAMLGNLADVELPQLLRRVASRPHARVVDTIVGRVLALLHQRRAVLLDPSITPEVEMRWVLDANGADLPATPAEDVENGPAADAAGNTAWRTARRQAAHAAVGWLGMSQKRWRDAAETYVALGREGIPEAAAGFARAVAAMRSEADEMVRAGDLSAALAEYRWLVDKVTTHAPDVWKLQSGLLCRVAMASAASGDTGTARNNFEAAFAFLNAGTATDRPMAGHASELREPGVWHRGDLSAAEEADEPRVLAGIFAGSVPAFWAHSDALSAISADPALTSVTRTGIDAILAALSLDDACRTRRSDLDSAATFPLTNTIVLGLGAALIPADMSKLSTLLSQTRDFIERTYGVRIPGVSVRDDVVPTPTGFVVLLAGVPVRMGKTAGTRSPRRVSLSPDQAVAELQDALVSNLAQLIGPDDLRTWASSSAAAVEDDVVRAALADAETRLRVHRVLRLLLRDAVPVTDRRAVLKAISDAVTGGVGTLEALESVRLRMAGVLPGTEPGRQQEQLPAWLENAVAQHLRAGDPSWGGGLVWQAPRDAASTLVAQLRKHLSSLPPDAVILVRNPSVRPFLVRLLAGPQPRPRILTNDELDAARAIQREYEPQETVG
jgi:tetratricopeptide (TPR) repeat protein